VVKRLSQHNLKMSSITMFKSFVKENNNSDKTCRYVHDLLLHKASSVKLQQFVNLSIKQNMNFKIQAPATSILFGFHKYGTIKIIHPLKVYEPTKMSWSHDNWWKFYIHLRNLNVRHIWMVEATELKNLATGTKMMWGTNTQRGRWTHKPTIFI
jgi:hypothetical protein